MISIEKIKRDFKKRPHNTRLCSLAADVHFAVFAPAFPFVALRQEIRPQTANAHSLGRYAS